MNGIYTPSEDADVFLRDNQRWMHMYELSTIELCGDLATKIMDDEMPKIIKGISLSNNKYMVNKPEASNNIRVNNNKSSKEVSEEDEDKKSKKSRKSRKSKISIAKEEDNSNENNIEDNKENNKENNIEENKENNAENNKENETKEEEKKEENNKETENNEIKEEDNEDED